MPPYIIIYHDRKGIKWIRIRLYCHIPPLTVLLFWSPHYWLLIKRNPFSWVSHNVQSDIRILFHFCRKRFIIYEMDFKTLFCLRRKDFIRQKLLFDFIHTSLFLSCVNKRLNSVTKRYILMQLCLRCKTGYLRMSNWFGNNLGALLEIRFRGWGNSNKHLRIGTRWLTIKQCERATIK